MKLIKSYCKITAGLAIIAFSINMFLGPHHIAAGGASGIGILLEYALGWDRALVIMTINIFMLVLAYIFLGKKTISKMIFGSFVFPLMIAIIPETMLTSDRLLSVLFGSAIFATGVSILYNNNASSGGTTIPPLILQKYFHINPSIGLLITDMIVVTFSLVVFSIEEFLFAIFSLVITSIVMNYIETGTDRKKSVMIMSENHLEEIQTAISEKLSRGLTLLNSQGGYHKTDKQIILIVINDQELKPVRELIEKIDPKAFVIVSNVADVMGSSFSYHPIE